MTLKEKLNFLEDLLDIEKDSLSEESALDQIDEWDSMAAIVLIAMFDETFDKVITPAEVKGFKIIKDIIDIME